MARFNDTSPGGGPVEPLVVFDLDGVLTRRDTLTALLLQAACRRPWRLAGLLGPLFALARYGDDVPRRVGAVERIVAVLLAGREAAEVDVWCAHVGGRAATSPRWVRPELVAEYRRLQQDGRRIVVATATEERVARALLTTAGLEATDVVGSRVTTSGGQAALDVYGFGPLKLRSLLEAGHDLTGATLYTDSRSDLPVARACRRTILVAPDRATTEAFSAAWLDARVFAREPQ